MEYGAATIVDELRSMELTEPSAAATAVYDRPIGLRLLYEQRGGEEHYLVRYPAGLRGRLHQHTAAHRIVLEGQLDVNGRVIDSGSYAHFPAGQVMCHQAAGGMAATSARGGRSHSDLESPSVVIFTSLSPFCIRPQDDSSG